MADNSIINILKINFSSLSLSQKVRTKELGRPTPELNLHQPDTGVVVQFLKILTMDEEMAFDIDVDVEDDPIKLFLLHKIREIKLHNTDLEKQINTRKKLHHECLDQMASKFEATVLEISGIWHRILNRKWIIGINVKNTSAFGSATNINVVLQWDCSEPLVYKTKKYSHYKHPEKFESQLPKRLKGFAKSIETNTISYPTDNELIATDEVKESTIIVISFEIPEFIEKTDYNICGNLSYQFREKHGQLSIPKFTISVRDLTSGSFAVKNIAIGEEESLLSMMIANDEIQMLVGISQNVYRALENLLEFNCLFKKLPAVSRGKSYFYVDSIDFPEECLLVVDKNTDSVYNMDVFCRDQRSLQQLLHYVHHNIPGIVIVPKKYQRNLLEMFTSRDTFSQQNASTDQSVLKQFGKSLESQIALVEQFCRKHCDEIPAEIVANSEEMDLNVSTEDYRRFRKELNDLEFKSDLMYLQIEKNSSTNEVIEIE